MANNTKKATNGKKKKGTTMVARYAARRVPRAMGVNDRVASHVNMIMDPCNATIAPTAYRGKDGFMNRFSLLTSNGPSADTCGIVAYWPRYNRVFKRDLPLDGTAFSLNFYDATFSFAGPGGVFLGANAGETRPVAACITSSYIGTELNRNGYVAQLVVPCRTTTGTLTIANLRQLAQKLSRTPDHEFESKWIPTPSDEEYEQIPAADPGINTGTDDNIIIHIMSGFSANTLNFYHRIVSVVEWQPYYGLGLVCPSPNTPDPPAGLEQVRSAISRFGHWWLEATQTARTAINVGANVYGASRALVAGAARVVPLLTAA